MIKKLALLYALSALFVRSPLYAQDDRDPGGFQMSLGGALAIKTNIRKDNLDEAEDSDPIVVPVPFASFAWGPAKISGRGLELTSFENGIFGVSALLSRYGSNYKALGMAKRKAGFFAGAGLKLFSFNAIFKKDIDNDSHGSVFDLSWTHRFAPLFNASIFPSVKIGAEYMSQKLLSYYYGVRPDEVTPERPAYSPTGGWSYSVGLNFMFKHTNNLSTIFGPAVKLFGSEVKNSPTVVRNEEYSVFIATFINL